MAMEMSERYSCLSQSPQPMEIVLLMGRGCFWKKCRFCDYYDDAGEDAVSIPLDHRVLDAVTGEFGRLVVLNSGSYFELPREIQARIIDLCMEKGIAHLHLESHWLLANQVKKLKAELARKGIALHPRIGIETFDEDYREGVMVKGMGYGLDPSDIAAVFDECCLLFGMEGQSPEQFERDLVLAKKWFQTVYINIFNDNKTPIKADTQLIRWFMDNWYEALEKDPQCWVLVENTALGVGD
ncbi:radical SAM protein [Eubacterium aggregans]|uniref:radical SAM protein n=1 Tax=Eubacterium aggregans TaxID=81409 RepID=UPI002B205A1D|nr:radical SAM protein [Eubacterium aggregans]